MLADLADCESEITESDEQLWRQVPPSRCVGALPILEVFIPSSQDERKLSVGQSSRVSAEQCFNDYTGALGCKSIGVVQLSVSSVVLAAQVAVDENPLTVRVVDDAACDEVPDWHGYIDFNGIEQKRHRTAFAQHLWIAATEGNWAYGPEDA